MTERAAFVVLHQLASES